MAGVDPSFHNLIHFVPENLKDSKSKNKPRESKSAYTGEDIKTFYESLIKEEPLKHSSVQECTNKNKSSKSAKKKKISEKSDCCAKTATTETNNSNSQSTVISKIRTERKYNKLLQAAQIGDLEQIKELLAQGLNINYTDFYGWTPLMCAAKEGHEEIVHFLLEQKADLTLCNSEGQTASELAEISGFEMLAKEIHQFVPIENTNVHYTHSSKNTAHATYFCSVCNLQVLDRRSHETSTIHLFNCKHEPKGPSYLIPETNRGFQMLLRSGWNKSQGLGLKGDGTKYPVKTVLKRDRLGLGGSRDNGKSARITHFDPCDQSAVQSPNFNLKRIMTAKTASRYASKRKERKEKFLEQKLRRQFNCDF
ncbi:G patch domain and ankyrin repeat-containing protein 1-like [Physella acuta]|uniref:G patch domain and ankyrin repeat-containing protein 1-like n=1 Tax=Physella acuta TaxID=109671 RepID=UPI0027DBED99|nr:G patch domain and ankyrin repeat-containing protein 1-like [Physella acuta]